MTGRIKQRNKDIAIYAAPFKFNGKELDEETGLYYYGARYLHPKYGMWLSCDPMEGKYPNVSSYCYTFANPIKYIDPAGSYPVMTITKQKTGTTTWQRIIGYTGQERKIITRVELYKVTVHNTEDINYHLDFSVTRDAKDHKLKM